MDQNKIVQMVGSVKGNDQERTSFSKKYFLALANRKTACDNRINILKEQKCVLSVEIKVLKDDITGYTYHLNDVELQLSHHFDRIVGVPSIFPGCENLKNMQKALLSMEDTALKNALNTRSYIISSIQQTKTSLQEKQVLLQTKDVDIVKEVFLQKQILKEMKTAIKTRLYDGFDKNADLLMEQIKCDGEHYLCRSCPLRPVLSLDEYLKHSCKQKDEKNTMCTEQKVE